MGIQDAGALVQCDFEIFGHVQGLGFTKCCRDLCAKQQIKGWVKNSKQGTILGKMQGTKQEIGQVVEWLSKEGAPGSQIEKAEFTNWGTITRYAFKDFAIRF